MPAFPTYHGELPKCLSPRKPRHYLLLAYWLYFRPTALKCYLYQAGPELYRAGPGRGIFRTLRVPAYRNLYWMMPGVSLLLSVLVGLPLALAASWIQGTPMSWLGRAVGVAVSVVFGVAVGVAVGVTVGVVLGVVLGVAGGVAFSAMFGVALIAGVLRIYFWLPELLWMLGLYFAGPPPARALRLLPPRFDELIYLPLPFMERIIVSAYRQDPVAARDTVRYLADSTNQQKTAARIQTSMALETLAACRGAADIARTADELHWLPDSAEAGLSHCLNIGRDVRAALDMTSAYRQVRALDAPRKALDDLQNVPAPRRAAQLGNIVQRWQNILRSAQDNLAQQAKGEGEIPFAYVAGNPLEPGRAGELFRGRIDLFREIENLSLAPQPPALLLHGGRRSGKTSVLKYLPRRTGAGVIPLFVDGQMLKMAKTPDDLAIGLAKQIRKAARLSRNLSLPEPPTALEGGAFPALLDWFEKAERHSGDRKLLLCLDEFERLEEFIAASGSRAPLDFLRHVMQHRSRWILLFSGAHRLDELEDYWSDYLINTRTLAVGYLHEADARDLIVKPTPDFPEEVYSLAAVAEIIRLSRCQPYLVQLLCMTVAEALNKAGRRRAELEDVQAAAPAALETGLLYFHNLWRQELTEKQRILLLCLARGGAITEEERSTALALVRKSVLEAEDGGFRFQVPLMQMYVEFQLGIKN
ncbi:MAG: ATP-binding protein [Gammaproteobacteria bacterium]|nr:ATP-binding protein [Gammaproteobacteria bacterium]